MNSSCPNSSLLSGATLVFKVLPYLVQDFLYGGVIPYVLYVSDSDILGTGGLKYVTGNCPTFIENRLKVPCDVTDSIFIVQCPGNEHLILNKINETISKQPSLLARPNIIIFVLSSFSSSFYFKPYSTFNTIVTLDDIQSNDSGDVIISIQHYKAKNVSNNSLMLIPRKQISEVGLLKDVKSLNMKGERLYVVTAVYEPFVYQVESVNNTPLYSGYAFSVLDVIAKKFNFRYLFLPHQLHDFYRSQTKFGASYDVSVMSVYGSKKPNGEWSGMVGSVHRQQADLSVAGLTITKQRATVVDFTYPFWFEPLDAAVKTRTMKLFYLFSPLKDDVWLIGLCTYLVTVISYSIIVGYSKVVRSRKKGNCFQVKLSSVWYITSIWLSQGGDRKPIKLRMIAGLVSLCLVAFWAAFTGNLIASLAVYTPKLPIESLEELAESKVYLPLIEAGTVPHTLFRESKVGVYPVLWKIIQENQPETLCFSYHDCRNKFLNNDHFVFIGDASYLQNIIEEGKHCEAKLIHKDFFPSGYGIAMPLGSPYKPFFDDAIKRMAESGLLLRFEEIHQLPTNCSAKTTRTTSSQALSWEDILAPIFIIGIGMASATFVLGIEVTYHYLLEPLLKRQRRMSCAS